jgi:hypothetical protein
MDKEYTKTQKNNNKSRLNFFNQIFKKKEQINKNIVFGRYSDRNKTIEQINFLKKAEELFSEKKYLEASELFFEFIKNDYEKNFNYYKKTNSIKFSFYQGSKKIHGQIDNKGLFAYSEIIKIQNENYQIYKILLELNYKLKFSKFTVENNIVKIILNLTIDEINTDLLYFALREIAIVADKYDDFFAIKFQHITPINNAHIIELDTNEFDTKIKYLKLWLKNAINRTKKLDPVKFAGARNFILLNFVYKTLYLIAPQGELLEKLTDIINYFHNSNDKTQVEKSAFILEKITEISLWNNIKFKNSLYYVTFTFPITLPNEPEKVINFAKNEIQKIYWYESNDYKDIANDILEYIIGYSSFHFGNIPLIDELFLLFFEITNKEYMQELGIKHLPFEKENISYFIIAKKIATINSIAKKSYPKFFFNIKHLNLQNRYEFAKSFIHEFVNLNFSI